MNALQRHQELVAANEDAAAFYRRQLLGSDAEGPRQYLADRGFAELLGDTPWTIGYAPAGWTTLHRHLADLGYSDETLLDAGLITRTRRGTFIDRFRDRITFGIRDAGGSLVGFTARRGPNAPAACPKYLNTPTTSIYKKSEQLFGLGESTQLGGQASFVAITEGPLDAIAVALAASEEPNAPRAAAMCGTTLSDRQAAIVSASCNSPVVLGLDSDAPGREAARRAYASLARHVSDVRVTVGTAGLDPADIYLDRPGRLKDLLASSVPAIQAIVDDCVDSWPTRGRGAESDVCCLRHTAGVVAAINGVDAASAARRLAQRLRIDLPSVTRELGAAATRSNPRNDY